MSTLDSPIARRLACEFVIAAAVCGAAYYFLVGDANAKLAKVRGEVAQAQARDTVRLGVGNLTEGQLNDLRRATAERVADIRSRSGPASDEAMMFARMSELAGAHALRIEQLNPTKPSGPLAAPAPPPGVQAGTPAAQAAPGAPGGAGSADPPAPPPKDTSVSYALIVTGAYSDIAAFLGALPPKVGYTAIRNVRISQPDISHPQQLRAEISSDHFAFDVSSIKTPPPSSLPPVSQPMPLPPDATPPSAAAGAEQPRVTNAQP